MAATISPIPRSSLAKPRVDRGRLGYVALIGGSVAYPARLPVTGRGPGRPSLSRSALLRVLRDLRRDQLRLEARGEFLGVSPIRVEAVGPRILVHHLPNRETVALLRPGRDGRYRLFGAHDWVEVPRAWRNAPQDGTAVIACLRDTNVDLRPLIFIVERQTPTAALVEAAAIGQPDEREILVRLLSNRLDSVDALSVVRASFKDPEPGVRHVAASAALEHPDLMPHDSLVILAEAEQVESVRWTLSLAMAASGALSLDRIEAVWHHWGWSRRRHSRAMTDTRLLCRRTVDRVDGT